VVVSLIGHPHATTSWPTTCLNEWREVLELLSLCVQAKPHRDHNFAPLFGWEWVSPLSAGGTGFIDSFSGQSAATHSPTTTAFDSASNLSLGWTNLTPPPKDPFDYIAQKRRGANETHSRLSSCSFGPSSSAAENPIVQYWSFSFVALAGF